MGKVWFSVTVIKCHVIPTSPTNSTVKENEPWGNSMPTVEVLDKFPCLFSTKACCNCFSGLCVCCLSICSAFTHHSSLIQCKRIGYSCTTSIILKMGVLGWGRQLRVKFWVCEIAPIPCSHWADHSQHTYTSQITYAIDTELAKLKALNDLVNMLRTDSQLPERVKAVQSILKPSDHFKAIQPF